MTVSVWQTILIYAGTPLVVYGLLAVLSLRRGTAKAPRYRPGQPWTYSPAWWVAHPAGPESQHGHGSPELGGAGANGSAAADRLTHTARGGARGSW